MYLNGNYSFNKSNVNKNISKNKSFEKNIIQLRRNTNKQKYGMFILNSYNNKTDKNNIETNENSSDISFYNSSLKNQILSPEDEGEEDIYQYKNKNIENFQKNNDDIDYNHLTTRSINNSNYTNEYNENQIFLKKGNKKILILDLDETLIHSSFQPLQINNKIIKPDIHFKIFFNFKYHDIFVYKRPFLNKFLKEMNKIFNIYVFTASIKKYAKPLLNILDKHNYIIKKFYRESCCLSEGKFIKDLRLLNLNLNDVIILDNNPISYKFNKKNGIPIKSWHFDKNDNELLKIIPFLNYLSTVDDVRKFIPYVIENEEINYDKINLLNINLRRKSFSLNKLYKNNSQKIRLNKKINFNINEEMKVNNNNFTGTINFMNPSKNKLSKMPLCNNNYSILNNINDINKKNIKKNKNKNNSISIINFNSNNNNEYNDYNIYNEYNEYGGNIIDNNYKFNNKYYNNNNIYYKSCNNFYINSKYSFVINQNQKEYETEKNNINNKKEKFNFNDIIEENEKLNNIINRNKNKSKSKKIPFSRKKDKKICLNKKINSNKEENIIINKKNCKLRNYLNRFNSYKNIVPYKNFESYEKENENDYNTITPLVRLNDDYINLRKNNTIEALGKNRKNSIRNIICYNSANCTRTYNNISYKNTINYDNKYINENKKCININFLSNNLKLLKRKENKNRNLPNNNEDNKIINRKNIQKLLTERINHNINNNNIFSNYSLKKEIINFDKNCYIKRKMKLKKTLINNKNKMRENTKSDFNDDYSSIRLIKNIPSSERNYFKYQN